MGHGRKPTNHIKNEYDSFMQKIITVENMGDYDVLRTEVVKRKIPKSGKERRIIRKKKR